MHYLVPLSFSLKVPGSIPSRSKKLLSLFGHSAGICLVMVTELGERRLYHIYQLVKDNAKISGRS